MNERNPVARSLGLDSAPLLPTSSLQSNRCLPRNIVWGPEQIGMSARVTREDAFHVSISLTDMPLHLLISERWVESAMRIVDMEGDIAARVFYPHEGVGFQAVVTSPAHVA